MTSKFVGFFRLVDACDHDGCPVCYCLRQDALRYLDALLYEGVNDPGARASLHASWGFCNWHAWMLPEILNSRFGTAIIYDDLLAKVRTRLRQLLGKMDRRTLNRGGLLRLIGKRSRLPILESWRQKSDCMVCRSGRTSEEAYLGVILDFTGDPEFDRAFERSGGICVPHLLRLSELGRDHPGLEISLKKIDAKWQQLQNRLRRFIDKHDYKATEPFTEEEARSWQQVVEILAGAPGIFGNEFHPMRLRTPSGAAPVMDRPPEPAAAEQDIEAVRFEKAKLELRLKQLTDQLSEVSSRAATLHYRLWEVLEDRKTLEMNLAGEQAASRLLERTVEELRKEVNRLRELSRGES